MEKEVLKTFFEFVSIQKLKFYLKVNLVENHISFPKSEITSFEFKKAMIPSDDHYLEINLNHGVKFQVSIDKITSLHFDVGREANNYLEIEDRISNFFKDEIRIVTMQIRDNSLDRWTFDFSPNHPSSDN